MKIMKSLLQNKYLKIALSFLLINLFSLLSSSQIYAQCAMCRISLENNANNGTLVTGSGMNTGILYLLIMPYLIIGIIIYMWRKNMKKNGRNYKVRKPFAS